MSQIDPNSSSFFEMFTKNTEFWPSSSLTLACLDAGSRSPWLSIGSRGSRGSQSHFRGGKYSWGKRLRWKFHTPQLPGIMSGVPSRSTAVFRRGNKGIIREWHQMTLFNSSVNYYGMICNLWFYPDIVSFGYMFFPYIWTLFSVPVLRIETGPWISDTPP